MLAQTVADQVFLHWRVDAGELRPRLPPGVEPDLHRGGAWLTITALRAVATRLRGTLPLPLVSSFLQVNVRAPVTDGGRPGVAFLSLDSSSPLAAAVARRVYGLPFHHARIALDRAGVTCSRRGADRPYVLSARVGPPRGPARGERDRFLVERYCLYARRGGRLARAEAHHLPWPIRRAEAAVELNTMAPDGLRLEGEPLVHVSPRHDVLVWPLRPV